jgi:hypothetical protein
MSSFRFSDLYGTQGASGGLRIGIEARIMAKSKLALYQQKRDFTKTAEPSGKAKIAPAKYPRFVIQKHAATMNVTPRLAYTYSAVFPRKTGQP